MNPNGGRTKPTAPTPCNNAWPAPTAAGVRNKLSKSLNTECGRASGSSATTATAVEPYLRAIADDTPPPTTAQQPDTATAPPTRTPPAARVTARPPAPRRGRALASCATEPPKLQITARASGHCEIVMSGCSYQLDRICSRLGPGVADPIPNAGSGYAACLHCHNALSEIHPQILRRLGYLTPPNAATEFIPFYWRQMHWVLLDLQGHLLDMPAETVADTA